MKGAAPLIKFRKKSFFSFLDSKKRIELWCGDDPQDSSYLFSIELILNVYDTTVLDAQNNKFLLMLANETIPLQIVKQLIVAGANAEILDNNKQTPLYYAVISGQTEMVKMLLDNNANPNRKDKDGTNLLEHAIYSPKMALLKIVVEKEYQSTPEDCSLAKCDPCVQSALWELFNAMVIIQNNIVEILLEKGDYSPSLRESESRKEILNRIISFGRISSEKKESSFPNTTQNIHVRLWIPENNRIFSKTFYQSYPCVCHHYPYFYKP